MHANPSPLLAYLEVTHTSKRWAQDRLLDILASGNSFPSFSAAVLKLMRLARDDEVGMVELTDLIGKEPGLATNCIRAQHP